MSSCFNHFNFMEIISFLYVLAVLTCAESLISHDDECVALFRFKQTNFHQDFNTSIRFQKLNSWRMITTNKSDDGSDCCLWDGVVCSNNKSRVIGLDLSRSSLRGPINSNCTLFNLVHLQMLNLSMNNFSESQIPSEIAHLKQLRSLDLSNSSFHGQIPIEISHLVLLSSLDLSLNPLKLQIPSLAYMLQNVTRLKELHLSGVDISSFVPRFLANFSSLESIYFDDCNLQDELPSEIFHLPKLKYLSMGNNLNLTGFLPEFHNTTLLEYLDLRSTSFAGIIPESITKLKHMVHLNLRQCHFSGHIPGSLSNLTQLATLYLVQNELTGQVPSLASLTKLVFLNIGENNFEKGSTYDWIGKLTNLNQLRLNYMDISQEILPLLSNLTKLTLLTMIQTSIFGQIPSSFMNLTKLSTISLRQNHLQGPLLSSFSNFKDLEYLDLALNNFSGTLDLDTFSGLNKLESLYLRNIRISFDTTNNNYTTRILLGLKYLDLSSCHLKEYPPFLHIQKKMIVLFLARNNIEGLVPVSIWNNSQETLQMIDLSFNFITGFEHHPSFLPWVKLGVFNLMHNQLQGRLPIPSLTTVFYDVSYNKLSGEIPSSICEVKSLQLLDLSSNNMTGMLPACLSILSNSLSVLNLKQNNFYGTMMNTFTRGNMLKRIDLSENRFTGQLPKSLINCTSLEVLSLGDNTFDDLFPFWLGSLPELKVLILGSNKFYGSIHGPTTNKSKFSKLRIIDLSNNGFSGHLPEKYFESWNEMKSIYVGESLAINLAMDFEGFTSSYEYSMTLTNKGVKTEYGKILNIFTAIDLSSNNFEGEIPQSLQHLQGLESLNLSNNHLTGSILTSLGNQTNLESLDLSNNNLLGEIPQELVQLGFLAIFNVSFNHLSGPIPQGKQFYTFQNNSYMGNYELCGEPLTKECQDSKSNLTPTSIDESDSSLLPSDKIDWIVIFLGVVSGFGVGIVFGNYRYAMYHDWFIERFELRKDRWVQPLSNRRRNQVLL